MSYIACSRNSNPGNRKKKLMIPFDKADELDHPDRYHIETEKAIGFKVNGQMIWLPKSQIEDFQFMPDDRQISCWCPQWLIEAKALEYFIDTSYEPGLFGDSVEDNMNDL